MYPNTYIIKKQAAYDIEMFYNILKKHPEWQGV